MRVVLISTPTRLEMPNEVPPTGILSMTAYLESLGHSVRVIDAAHRRPDHHTTAREAAEFQPDLIGVGGIITSYSYIIGLTQVLKQVCPAVPIVLGGQVVINTTRLCFENMPIDYIINGYGEIPLAKLVEHLEGKRELKTIPGLSYLDAGRIASNPGREFFKNVDDMPLPAYRHIDMEYYCTVGGKSDELVAYLKRTGKSCDNFREFSICGALGCIGKCNFCIHEQEFVGVHFFSPQYIVRHMKFLQENYNVNVFGIGEEMYIANVKSFRELCRLISEQLPGVFWKTHGRAESFTPEIVAEMDKANIFCAGFGVESFCDRILRIMYKANTGEVNLRSCQRILKTNTVGNFSFIIGNIGEDRESINETLEGINHLRGTLLTGAFYATAYPGGRMWDWAVERGIIPDPHAYLLRMFNQNALAFSVNLTPFPDWILHYWNRRVNAALRLVQQKRRFLSSKRLNWYLLSRGLAVWAYFVVRRAAKLLGMRWDDPKFDFAVDKNGAMIPDKLIKGGPSLAPQSKRLENMLNAGPSFEPFTDHRGRHTPPAWWKGSYAPMRYDPEP